MAREKPLVQVRQILQLCVVVNDLQKAMERYWRLLGIGPWRVFNMEPPFMTGTTLRGEKRPYTMKLALAEIGDVQWELVQPLEGPSIYKDFLARKGEGLHHVAFAPDDFEQAVSAFADEGITIQMSGSTQAGDTFAYMDTEESLGAIMELFKPPRGVPPPVPHAVWPPKGQAP